MAICPISLIIACLHVGQNTKCGVAFSADLEKSDKTSLNVHAEIKSRNPIASFQPNLFQS